MLIDRTASAQMNRDELSARRPFLCDSPKSSASVIMPLSMSSFAACQFGPITSTRNEHDFRAAR
jgi:hypothetical protein